MHLRIGDVVMGGRSGPLIITDFTRPVTEKRGSSTDRLRGHGQDATRRWLGGRTWSWTLATNGHSLAESVAMAESVERAWLDYADMASTVPTPLEYSLDEGATWFRVYGQTGRITSMTPDVRAVQGVGLLDLEFEQLDPRHFSSELSSTTIQAAPSTASTGWVAPFVFPLVSGATGDVRAGTVFNAGDKPTPLTVTFYGPCTDPRVWAGDVSVGYSGALAADQWVRVDALSRSVVAGGYDRPEVPVPGRLVSDLGLVDLVAPTGWSDWSYAAKDPTGSSRAVISWRSAFTSMQYGGL